VKNSMTDYYIVARSNGWDWETGNTINYRSHIGQTITPAHPQTAPYNLHYPPLLDNMLHAAKTNYWACVWHGDYLPVHHATSVGAYEHPLNTCSFYLVQGTYVVTNVDVAVHPDYGLYGFLSLYIVSEMTQAQFEASLPW
jgi:hypothetical protein